jgi:phenylpropionate dioxygenase-like ring-hydroxylating dioxygenase large terminal subunit
MDQDTQSSLLRRAAAHLAAGTTDAANKATRFEASIYTDEQRLKAERQTLFSQFPLTVGFSDQLKAPGDYITHDHTGVPILVCRKDDGGLAAFLNICRHRGTRLAPAKAGHVDRVFVCRYHAWSYDTCGQLRGVPCGGQFAEVDKQQTGLLPLPVSERAGLVWVVPRGGQCDVDSYFGACARELQSFGLNDWEVYATKTVHCKLNWKMMIEANQESYHINVLHRDTAGPRFMSQLSLFDEFGPHTRTALLHKDFARVAAELDPSISKILAHSDLVYFLFPNTLILLSPESAHVLTAFPQSPGHTVVYGATLVPRGTRGTFAKPYYEKYWSTILEDISVSEPIQASSEACPDLELWLGRNETLIAHFHGAIERAIRNELVPPRIGVASAPQRGPALAVVG